MPQTTPEWDCQEVEWWDANAEHIERIWGLSQPLCVGVRQRYIEDIRGIFLRLKEVKPLRILEIACGSGWPGRILASSELRVTGVDFSEMQIQIARLKAAEIGQTNCDYVQMDINGMNESFQSGQFDGAFIHCGIHHLSTPELVEFSELLGRSPRGFPVILVEPVYLDQKHLLGSLLGKAINALFYLLAFCSFAGFPADETVRKTTQRLADLATDKGWFFSPKEVPFDTDEIRSLFSPYFEIMEITPVTYFGLRAAQYAATLRDEDRASRAALRIIPLLNFVDRLLIKTKLLPTTTRDYLFCRIVLMRS
ncbi:methyltransferase domain-containing protein [Alloacidobacterium dinghuense]|uniref:Methyltransferase domain-containing protein n=1 Tax=Alloacidobacterium dinghuense TaxID=2763107 RepID=A0A7G8BE06_9BACT|nr:class I SAM-dependent methyltransferase [Alloacidobacterium dinghuense]QNI30776.1 methyltransferase domain-containing protein [Alloacidobacterium dinghuense]